MGQSCSWRLFLLRISVYVNLALVDFRVREFITIKDPYWMNQNQSLLMVGEAEVATVVVVVAPSCPWSIYLGDWFLGCSHRQGKHVMSTINCNVSRLQQRL